MDKFSHKQTLLSCLSCTYIDVVRPKLRGIEVAAETREELSQLRRSNFKKRMLKFEPNITLMIILSNAWKEENYYSGN